MGLVFLFNTFDNIIQQHKKRYLVLNDFYMRLQNEIDYSHAGNDNGAAEVIRLIERIIIKKEKPLEFLFSNLNKLSNTPFVETYLDHLRNELLQ